MPGFRATASATDQEVVVAHSRGPESLRERVEKLGPSPSAASAPEAARLGDVVIESSRLGVFHMWNTAFHQNSSAQLVCGVSSPMFSIRSTRSSVLLERWKKAVSQMKRLPRTST